MLTICTTTYNRQELLPRLYESLLSQSCYDFEWIIVDDGSTDNTSAQISNFKSDKFPIKYIHKDNGGKHTAINVGVQAAKGDLFFLVDSDDMLAHNAVEEILRRAIPILRDDDFAGVSGICKTMDGQVIGSGIPNNVIDATAIDIRIKYGVIGDLAEVFKTDVLRRFPFPEIVDEKFCPEALVWNRIARTGKKLRYFNVPIYIAEYQPGGLTARITRIRMEAPVASTTYYGELGVTDGLPCRERVKAVLNYWRFRACLSAEGIKRVPRAHVYWQLFRPAGYLLHLRDKKSVK